MSANPNATITETPSIEQLATRQDAQRPPPETPAAAEAKPPTPEEQAKADADKAAEEAKAAERAELSELAKAQREKVLERRKLQSERERLARQREHFERAAKERDELAAKLATSKTDPLKFVEEQGTTAEQLVARAVKANTPEAAIQALNTKIAELEKREQDRLAEAERQREEQSRAQQMQTYRQAQANFMEMVTKDEERFPVISAIAGTAPHLVWSEAEQLVTKVLEYNRAHPHEMVSYTDEEIATFLEQRMTPVYKKLEERKKVAASTPNGKTAQAAAGSAGAGSAGPRTLSNGLQSEVASEQLDLSKLTPQEQIRALAQVYEKNATQKRGA